MGPELSILIIALVSFIFGWLWYGPLFGKAWMREMGIKMDKNMKCPWDKMFYQFILSIIMVSVFFFLFGTHLTPQLMLVAFLIWLGFILTNRLGSMLWMKQSWTLFFIDAVYHLANLVIVAVMINPLK
jgi:hypothetical protein